MLTVAAVMLESDVVVGTSDVVVGYWNQYRAMMGDRAKASDIYLLLWSGW